MKKIKFIALLGALFAFFGATGASADTTILTWERGMQQSVTIGGNTSSDHWTVHLESKSGQSWKFSESSVNKKGFIVYSLYLPSNFKVGEYTLFVTSATGGNTTTSLVNVVEATSYHAHFDPKKMGFIFTSIVAFLYLLWNSDSESSNKDEPSTPNSNDLSEYTEENQRVGVIDRLKIGKSEFIRRLDSSRYIHTYQSASRSPFFARIYSDSSWVQALFGPLVLLSPALGITGGALLAWSTDMSVSLVPDNLFILIPILILGVFDTAAGLLAAITFAIYALTTINIVNVIDLRTVLGLTFLFFAPAAAIGRIRPMRRKDSEWKLWDRLTDFTVAPLMGFWIVKGIIVALDAFSLQETDLAKHANAVSAFVAGALLLRYLAEEATHRLAPARLNYLVPTELPKQEFTYFVGALTIKILFLFLYGIDFFSFSWQLVAALLMLLIFEILKYYKEGFPNSPILFQLLPSGIPGLVFMGFLGLFVTKFVDSLPLIGQDKIKTIFILIAIPGFLISLIRMFGRKPSPGDVKWYCRPHLSILYKVVGPIFLSLSTAQSLGVFS